MLTDDTPSMETYGVHPDSSVVNLAASTAVVSEVGKPRPEQQAA